MRKLKILEITSSFPIRRGHYSGSFIFDEAQAISKRGHEIYVLTQHYPFAKYIEEMNGVKVFRFNWLKPQTFLQIKYLDLKQLPRLISYLLSCLLTAVRIVKVERVDIIHAQWAIPAGFIGMLVAKLTNRHLITTVHGSDLNIFPKRLLYRFPIILALKSSDFVITVSTLLSSLTSRYTRRQAVIFNAVDTNIFKPVDASFVRAEHRVKRGETLILFVGALIETKGITHLLEAFYELLKSNSKVRLMIMGNGVLANKIKDIPIHTGGRVILINSMDHDRIWAYFNAADIFVLPSLSEGMSLSVLEAMACGKPVIASRVGGAIDNIKDGFNGLMIEPGSIYQLVSQIDRLIKDDELRHKLSINAVNTIREEFNLSNRVDQILNIYYKVLMDD